MKTRIALTAVLAALLPAAAFAQNPDSDNPPPVPAVAPAPGVPPVPAVAPVPPQPRRWHGEEREKGPVTFLGVETSRVPRVLSEQLGLQRGFGVVVDYVVPESAAATAGVQQSDIVKMLNDQIIVDSDQLGVLVRSFADGATVNLKVLRKGQELNLSAKLKQKTQKTGHGPVGYEWNFDGFDGMDNFQTPDMSAVRESVARAKQQALKAGDQAREAMRKLRIVTTEDGAVKAAHVDLGKVQLVFSDEQGELRLETIEGKKMLTAKDASGKELFRGPVNTDEERAKVPAEVRKRYETLEHQELPPIPPNEELAPRAPGPNDSAQSRRAELESAALVPSARSGWTRSTMLL